MSDRRTAGRPLLTPLPTPAELVSLKFHPDGSFRRFRGNTVVCMIERHSRAADELTEAQLLLRRSPLGSVVAFVPPSSFHMTLFELLCDSVRFPAVWSRYLRLDAPIEESDRFFEQRLKAVVLPSSLAMDISHFSIGASLGPALKPRTRSVARILRDLRDSLAVMTGVRFPDHDEYQFHITLAYVLADLTVAERLLLDALRSDLTKALQDALPVVPLEKPQLRFFEDMAAYSRSRLGPSGR